MRNSKAKEITGAFALALVYLISMLLPILFSVHHRHNLILHNSPTELNGGLMFSYPQICWIWTTSGIVVSVICLVFMVLLSWVLSRKFKGFSLSFWICLSIFGWASFWTAFSFTHHKNRLNYVFINDKEIIVSRKGETDTLVIPNITEIEIKETVVVFSLKDRKNYRLPRRDISLLIGNNIFIEKLEILAEALKRNSYPNATNQLD